MPVTIETVYCKSCNLATPKAYSRCIHCKKLKDVKPELILVVKGVKHGDRGIDHHALRLVQ